MEKIVDKKLERISGPKTGLFIEGVWYNAADADAQKTRNLKSGDIVSFDFENCEVNGRTGNHIKTVVLSKPGSAKKPFNKAGGGFNKGGNDSPEKQRIIASQSCLGYAAQLVASTMTGKSDAKKAAEVVKEIAESIFLPFVLGKPIESAAKQGAKPAAEEKPTPKQEYPTPDVDSDSIDEDDDNPY